LAGLCFCRDTLAARRSLTTSGPQPEERTGHGPFWGKSSIRRAVANAPDPDGSRRAGAEAAERWRAGRRPAPGESRYIATGTRAMSRLWTGLIALTAASRLSPMATAEGVKPARPHPQARAYTLASRGDRAWGPGGRELPRSAARCVGSTRNVAHGVAPDNPLQNFDPVRLRPRQGDGCDTGLHDGRSERATRSATAQQTSRHTTPLQQPGFL